MMVLAEVVTFIKMVNSECAHSANIDNHLCNHEQSLALLQFKQYFTIGSSASTNCDENGHRSYPKTMSWNMSADCCTWDGVLCDELTGNVIDLDLSCSQLQGKILPNSSLFQLTLLQRLNLASNDLSPSGFPQGFSRFASLTHLNLSDSRVSGQITSEISKLSKLVSLDLSGNIDGLVLGQQSFKMLVQNLTFIKELFLSDVEINSVIPRNLSSSLTYLDLSGTGLHGKLPEEIFHLPNLKGLELMSNCELEGQLPKTKWRSSQLEVLSLSGTGLSGELPDAVTNMKSLTYLDLSDCKFSGSISDSFGNLTRTSHLLLSSNNFSGQLPSRLSNLEQLTRLDLSDNHLHGQIPEDFGKLKKLTDLSLGRGNKFSGHLPLTLVNLTRLEFLDLSNNSLTGPIPSNGSGFQNLISLSLSNNSFSGTIPTWLFSLPTLVYLDLGSNRFGGQIHEVLFKSMEFIDLSNNELQGPIPKSISELVNLTDLCMQSNNLIGDVELSMFSKLERLRVLSLSYNSLSLVHSNDVNTRLPSSLVSIHFSSCRIMELDFLRNTVYLRTLDLSNNEIHGQIPDWAWSIWSNSLSYLDLSGNFLTSFNQLPLKCLRFLDLRFNLIHGPLPIPPLHTPVFLISNNKLTGEVPSSICNMTSLLVLDVSHNGLGGLLPRCLGMLGNKLSVLNLQMNGFRGTIPRTFGKGCSLRNINLNGNNLEGTVPQSLANCRQLEVLNLGKNKMNGTFPHRLATLPELQVLVLRSNRFHGLISSSSYSNEFSFIKLRILDLSHNGFTGHLPETYIKSFRAMMSTNETRNELKYMGEECYQDSVSVVIKGLEVELVRILTVFTAIDLSSNNFSGEIPTFIGDLTSLLVLNFSHNNLEGHVPSLLGNVTSLESLDLSSNQLTGEIPVQLTSLTFLAVLNLSQNHLVGRIPRGNQFDTFQNDSYSGNSALCGFPLSKDCTENKKPENTLREEEDDDDSDFASGFTWKVVLMGYCYGTVFGLLMGYLTFR